MPMQLHIDIQSCVGCGCCLEACAQGALELDTVAVLIAEHCIACGACIEMCPTGALRLD